MMALRSGRAIRFPESKVRPMGRNAAGVRGVTLAHEKDEVVGMVCICEESSNILVVSENGYGKRSDVDDYRITNRGGKGVKTINVSDKTGQLIAIKDVIDGDELMIMNKSGITIRMAVSAMRVMGRATQGVRLIKLQEKDKIAAVAKVRLLLGDENEELEEGAATEDGNNTETSGSDNEVDNTDK
jgi:DNA gyrase subunit A